jgi:hypothetical protein
MQLLLLLSVLVHGCYALQIKPLNPALQRRALIGTATATCLTTYVAVHLHNAEPSEGDKPHPGSYNHPRGFLLYNDQSTSLVVRLIVSQGLELSSYCYCYRYCYRGVICSYWDIRYYCWIYNYWYCYCMLRANQQPEPHYIAECC